MPLAAVYSARIIYLVLPIETRYRFADAVID